MLPELWTMGAKRVWICQSDLSQLIDHSSSYCLRSLLLFRHSSVLWFCYKEGSGVRKKTSFLLLFQLIKPLLIMKFALALLPIAAALQFVVAGPVAAEGLVVCALMFSSQIYRAHYQHVVGQACSRPGHKARL
jgi:hypothetical protein